MPNKNVEIHVEPKDALPYADLPPAARDAVSDALLILIQRGRLHLAGQAQEQIDAAEQSKENH